MRAGATTEIRISLCQTLAKIVGLGSLIIDLGDSISPVHIQSISLWQAFLQVIRVRNIVI